MLRSWTPSRDQWLRSVPLANEIPKLVLLAALTTAAFAGTRALAGHERAQRVEDARAWYARGVEAGAGGRLDEAIADLRRALTKDRDNRTYALALAGALAEAGQLEAAERTVAALRARAPDDAEANLQLARIAARRGETESAVAYYRNALYAPWDDQAKRFDVRLELSELLLDSRRTQQALSELIAADANAPEDAAVRLRLAELLARAGDPRRALGHFTAILAADADNPRALAGAGSTAFDLGEYALALRYLDDAPADPSSADKRMLASIIVGRDPLAARLGAAERRRRAAANFADVTARLASCRSRIAGDAAVAALDAASAGISAASSSSASGGQDALEDGLAAIGRAEQALAAYCDPPEPIDRALRIIVARHADAP